MHSNFRTHFFIKVWRWPACRVETCSPLDSPHTIKGICAGGTSFFPFITIFGLRYRKYHRNSVMISPMFCLTYKPKQTTVEVATLPLSFINFFFLSIITSLLLRLLSYPLLRSRLINSKRQNEVAASPWRAVSYFHSFLFIHSRCSDFLAQNKITQPTKTYRAHS
jgi:hypothetical protein